MMQHFFTNVRFRLESLLAKRWTHVVLLLIVVVLASIQLVALHRVGHGTPPGYTSDDVAQQTILSQWQRGYHEGAGLGDDNWYLKFPLYWGLNQLQIFPDSRAFAASWILTMTTLVGVVIVLWRILQWAHGARPPSITARLLPVAAMASLAPLALYNISIINTRNIEIPLFLLLLYALLAHSEGVIIARKNYWWIAGIVALSALLLTDDPIFFYMGAVPILAVLAARVMRPKEPIRRWLEIGAIVGVGVVGRWVITKILVHLLPIVILVHPAQFANIDAFFSNWQTLISRDLILFGANIWGQVRSLGTAMSLLNLSLLGVSLVAAWRLVRFGRSDRKAGPGILTIGILPFWIIGLVLFANFHAEARYLLLLPFILAAGLVIAISRGLISPRIATMIVLLFMVSATYNTATAIKSLVDQPQSSANNEDQAVVRLAQAHGLSK